MTLLFIYGTLKRGESRAHLLEGQHFLGEVWTESCYLHVDFASVRCMAEVDGDDVAEEGDSVAGELWEVDDACLARLDQVQGVNNGLIQRNKVKLIGHEEMEAHFYTVEG